MAAISASEFQTETDSIAYAHEQLVAAIAAAGVTNAVTAATNEINRVKALTDADAIADLIRPASDMKKALQVQAGAVFPAVFNPAAAFGNYLGGLNKNTGGVNAFCESSGAQVIDSFRNAAAAAGQPGWVKSKYVQPPQTSLATGTVTGAAAVTFGAAAAVNINDATPPAYGPQGCELHVTTIMPSGDASGPTVVTATMKKYDGSLVPVVINVPHNSAALFDVNVGDGGATAAQRYVDCTALAVANGASGAFTIRTKAPRSAAA